MEQIIENGTEVLIFNYVDISNIKSNYNKYIIGNVKNYNEKYESAYKKVYEIIGEDGKIYYASHKYPKQGIPFYIRTREEHINSLNDYLTSNNGLIIKLNQENQELQIIVDSLNQEEKHKTR